MAESHTKIVGNKSYTVCVQEKLKLPKIPQEIVPQYLQSNNTQLMLQAVLHLYPKGTHSADTFEDACP